MATPTQAHYVTPDCLCVGLYIRLDLDWSQHPFAFNQFKIKNQAQIDTLRALGLDKIRYDPSRSDVVPAPSGDPPAVAPPPPVASDEAIQAGIAAKKARIERVARQRAAIHDCEKKLLGASRAIKGITRNLFARPQESLSDANTLVEGMLDSMLTERDIAIQLMNDKLAGEEVYHHPLNVAVLAMMLGKQLKLDREEMRLLGLGALFHDIGKVEIPEKLLYKTEALSPSEAEIVERHVQFGLEIGKKLSLPPEVLAVVFQHHEHVDGSGYPHGLKGAEILPLSKIVCIANVYDNLCNKLNPKDALTPYEALAFMFAQHRSHFEQGPLNLFIRCMGVYPPGALVQLSNNALGMVMAVNTAHPLKPCVLIYEPAVPKHEAVILDLEDEPELQIVKNIRPAQLPQQVFDYLNPRKRMTYYFDASEQRG